jgi:hypothetical protein
MRYISLASATASFVQCSFATMSIHDESRFGLTFSPTFITASRFVSADADAVNLTKYPTTAEYQDFYRCEIYATSASLDATNDTDFHSMLNETMRPIVDNLTHQLGYAAEFSALSLPTIWRQYTRYGAVTAVFGPDYVTKLSSTHNATCWAYGFLEGRNLGRALADCNEDGPENYVLVLEFEAEHMYAWLINVDFEIGKYFADRRKFCERCGEENRKVICPADSCCALG